MTRTVKRRLSIVPDDSDFWFPEIQHFNELDTTPVEYRIAGLWPVGCNVLFSAYAKTGKTTLAMYLINALVEGDDFLGRECKKITGNVVYINLEMFPPMLVDYANKASIELANEHLLVMDYQGNAGKLLFNDEYFREDFAAKLKSVSCEILVIDPISAITSMMGIDSNSIDDMRRVLENLSSMSRLAGCNDLVIDHTGHADKGRARNSSAKLDWADALWNLERVGTDEMGTGRKLKSWGRGVDETIHYRMEDGDIISEDEDAFDKPTVMSYLSSDTPKTVEELAERLGKTQQAVSKQLLKLESRSKVKRKRVGRRDEWYLAE